ncbi:MAG: hypothetical protein IPP40_16575 [bacterium]|nr:hypothetical protein [bacterium]
MCWHGRTIGTGNLEGDILILKMSYTGDTLWSRRYGTGFPDAANDIIQVAEDRFLVAGTAGDPDALGQYPINAFALMINDSGDSLWMRTYGNNYFVSCYDIEQDGASGFFLDREHKNKRHAP